MSNNPLVPDFDASELFAQVSAATGGLVNRMGQVASEIIEQFSPDLQSVHTKQDAEQLTIEMALPGYAKDGVSVEADGGTLIVTAKAPEDNKLSFYAGSDNVREFPLPKGARSDKMTAKFSNGVLRITVPISGTPAVRVTVV